MVTYTSPDLSPDQLATLHAMLEEQRRFRLEQLATAPKRPASEADREVQQTILRGAHLALTDIESALGRIASGRYGRCTKCGTRLSPVRLEVLPQAALCMNCQRREAAAH